MSGPDHASGTELERLVAALRRAGHAALAAQVLDAERGGTTGSEILSDLGGLLNAHAGLRATLDGDGQAAWDALLDRVCRAFPGFRWRVWLARWFGPRGHVPVPPVGDTRPLAERFSDAQMRACYLAIRAGLDAGDMTPAQARQHVIAIRPEVFDQGFGDGEKQAQDYEKRQLLAAVEGLVRQQPGVTGNTAAALLDRALAQCNLR